MIAASLTVLVAKLGGWQGTALVGAIFAIGLWILFDRRATTRIGLGPKLRLYFDPDHTGDRASIVEDGKERATRWMHLHVADDGFVAATQCECWIEEIATQANGSFETRQDFQFRDGLDGLTNLLLPPRTRFAR